MAFTGFGKDGLPFLKALGFHQNREWFLENKKIYESQLREPLVELVESASERLDYVGIPLKGARKTSLFRINRDVRFSKEKHPYKTNIGAVLSRTGTKKDTGGIYMHFANDGCFLASGLWFPPNPLLKAMRGQIVAREKDFLKIAKDLEAAGLLIETDRTGGMLSRPPQGFKDVDDEILMNWLKHKSFVVQKPLNKKDIHSEKLLDEIESFAKAIMPFMQFIWRATDPLREEDGNA